MSVVAISESMGSLGIEVGRRLAAGLGYEFAERDIITKAADRFGQDAGRLSHAVEERPTLLERFTAAQRRLAHYVEATVHEMAARDNIVLVGLASTIILGGAPHTLRVRITASPARRAQRVAQEQGLGPAAAEHAVRDSDRERAGRMRFLYHVDWEDPLRYHLVINTDELGIEECARLVRLTLEHERFLSTEASRHAMTDLSLASMARAMLMTDPATRVRSITVECSDGVVAIGGRVEEWPVRRAAEQLVSRVPGVRGVRFLTPPAIDGEGAEDPDRDLHGDAHHWGGFGRSQ